MNEMNMIPWHGQRVRQIGEKEDPYFLASDVCQVCGLENVTKALTRVSEVNITSSNVPNVLGRQRLAKFVNEKGLWQLVLDSRKPQAVEFSDRGVAGVQTRSAHTVYGVERRDARGLDPIMAPGLKHERH